MRTKTAELTEEKVEQLRAFKGSKGSVEMMPEVVKEAARRIPFSFKPMPVLEFGVLEEEDARWLKGIKNQVKVTLTVEGGWSKDSFEVDCNGWRSSLLWPRRQVSNSFWLRHARLLD